MANAFRAAMLARLPLTITEELDPGAVDQQVQWPVRTAVWDVHFRGVLAMRQRAEVRHRPVQANQMGWLPPSPDGIAKCQCRGVQRHTNGEDGRMKDTIIGMDLAKRVFQLHGATVPR